MVYSLVYIQQLEPEEVIEIMHVNYVLYSTNRTWLEYYITNIAHIYLKPEEAACGLPPVGLRMAFDWAKSLS